MKKLATTLLLFTGIFMSFAQTHLFRIVTNGKTGYMDASGRTIIEPKYHNGTDFFGEYAAVRENGLYGIINTKGDYVLNPSYGIILQGIENYTIGKNNGKSELIDLTGKIVFKKQVRYCKPTPDYLFVYTPEWATYVFDRKTGKEILYSPYQLSLPYEDICIANNMGPEGDLENYVTTLSGKIIVPKGTYKNIAPFQDGVAKVQITYDEYGVIDTTGKLLYRTQHNLYTRDGNGEDMGGYNEGYIMAKLIKPGIDEYQDPNPLYGYLDKKGNIPYTDSLFMVRPFKNGKTVIFYSSGENKILDKNFKAVDPEKYWPTVSNYFTEETDTGWIVTDNKGKQLIRLDDNTSPTFNALRGDILFYSKTLDTINETDKIGFINLKTLSKLPPIIDSYTEENFENGLLRAMVNKKLTYINENGKIVWQQSDDATIKPLNIDYMLRGNFKAYDKTTKKHNGWATSDNFPLANKKDMFKPKQLSVVIDTVKKNTFNKTYEGMSVYIANTTSTPLEFSASDSRLEMVIQAKDETGKWKDITYNPRSSCGNSYHTLHLPKNEHWELTMPVFDGSFETEIRIKLTPEFNGKEYYSNSIKAKVNPGQFFYQQPYYAQNIMDPYNE
jgi:hypothetical protein